jgi:hypothetical protein
MSEGLACAMGSWRRLISCVNVLLCDTSTAPHVISYVSGSLLGIIGLFYRAFFGMHTSYSLDNSSPIGVRHALKRVHTYFLLLSLSLSLSLTHTPRTASTAPPPCVRGTPSHVFAAAPPLLQYTSRANPGIETPPVCVCVERERERESARARAGGREVETDRQREASRHHLLSQPTLFTSRTLQQAPLPVLDGQPEVRTCQ